MCFYTKNPKKILEKRKKNKFLEERKKIIKEHEKCPLEDSRKTKDSDRLQRRRVKTRKLTKTCVKRFWKNKKEQ